MTRRPQRTICYLATLVLFLAPLILFLTMLGTLFSWDGYFGGKAGDLIVKRNPWRHDA